MNISTFGIPKAGLPDGFVYIDELIEDCIIDAKYAGTDVKMDGVEYKILSVKDALAVIE